MSKERVYKQQERDGLRRLIKDRFGDNRSTCAKVMKVSPSTISRVLSGKMGIGPKLMRGIIAYFQRNDIKNLRGIDYRDYFYYRWDD